MDMRMFSFFKHLSPGDKSVERGNDGGKTQWAKTLKSLRARTHMSGIAVGDVRLQISLKV